MTARLSSHPQAIDPAAPTVLALAGSNLPPSQGHHVTHHDHAGRDLDTGQPIAAAVPIPDPAVRSDEPHPAMGLAKSTLTPPGGVGADQQETQSCSESQALCGALLVDPTLYTLAAGLDDIEDVRKSQANRLGALTRDTEDSDGEVRGFGLTEDHPAVLALTAQMDGLKALEHQMELSLRRQLRTHPLHPWIKAQNGLGDKTVARLLAAIGDPYWNDLHDRPRTIGELFAFCGVAGPGYKRRKGSVCNWNGTARMRLWNIVQPIIKNRASPYRKIYDEQRERYSEAVHTEPCAQCGPKGKPAEPGSELRDGHKHARAVRIVMREILRGLWTEAQSLYEPGSDGHSRGVTHSAIAVAADQTTGDDAGHPSADTPITRAGVVSGQDQAAS